MTTRETLDALPEDELLAMAHAEWGIKFSPSVDGKYAGYYIQKLDNSTDKRINVVYGAEELKTKLLRTINSSY